MKRIHTEADLATFIRTSAYARLTHRLQALCDEARSADQQGNSGLDRLLEHLSTAVDEFPPDDTKHRFGHPKVREWHVYIDQNALGMLHQHLKTTDENLLPYLLGAFGSAERLDYGTGHELSFLALIEALIQAGALPGDSQAMAHICKRTLRVYFSLVQKLIQRYKLEPAGSHGVWGLDDHFAQALPLACTDDCA